MPTRWAIGPGLASTPEPGPTHIRRLCESHPGTVTRLTYDEWMNVHKHHRRYQLPTEQCMECDWARARCQAKVRYHSHIAANVEATARNEATGYEHMLSTYPCPWCDGFHLTRARPRDSRWKRVERRRRRWLVRQMANA